MSVTLSPFQPVPRRIPQRKMIRWGAPASIASPLIQVLIYPICLSSSPVLLQGLFSATLTDNYVWVSDVSIIGGEELSWGSPASPFPPLAWPY